MRASLADVEILVLVVLGTAALYFFIAAGMQSEPIGMLGGLVGYLVVWVYGLVRASYSGPGPA
jgi:hypothetical protein